MVSGLFGRSLSEVKDYWKETSNGQSSFARNPEATSSWLASLSLYPAIGRLNRIVDFLPELLVTKRLHRPSAQSISDRLNNLSLLFPDPPHLINSCCGPPLGWMDNIHPERIGGSGLPKTRDPKFWFNFCKYFEAVADAEMTYVILDQRFNQVAAKHDCYSNLWDTLNDVSSITAACDTLFLQSGKTVQKSFYSHGQIVASTKLELDHVLPQVLEAYTSWRVIFTALSVKLPTPEAQYPPKGHYLPKVQVPFKSGAHPLVWRKRTLQISMVDHSRRPVDDHYFNSVFYVLTFKLFDRGYEPSKLGAPFLDLSMTTPSRLAMDNDWGVDFETM